MNFSRALRRLFCLHTVVDGFDLCGDGLVCTKCGKHAYPEDFGWYLRELPDTEENWNKAQEMRRAV